MIHLEPIEPIKKEFLQSDIKCGATFIVDDNVYMVISAPLTSVSDPKIGLYLLCLNTCTISDVGVYKILEFLNKRNAVMRDFTLLELDTYNKLKKCCDAYYEE